MKKGGAVAFGAVSIVNAIASGRGATAAVGLTTRAEVRIDEEAGDGGWRVKINGRDAPSSSSSSSSSSSNLAIQTVGKVLEEYDKKPEHFSGLISTTTEIPMGVGLKSSSSSSVAIALATLASLGEKEFEEELVLKLSAEASLASGASITGALDDAASCLLGGINHAHNLRRRLIKSAKFDEPLRVLVFLPRRQRSHRTMTNVADVRRFSRLADDAFRMSMKGEHWRAMTFNGLLYSAIYGYDPSPALSAIRLGAAGAGLSGTGPATASVFSRDRRSSVKSLIREWRASGGSVIVTKASNERGRIVGGGGGGKDDH